MYNFTYIMNPNVRKTLFELLSDRSYNKIESEDEVMVSMIHDNGIDKLMVYFIYDTKVSVKKIKTIKEILEDNSHTYKCLIVVYKSAITTFAKQFISSDVKDLFVQIFSEKELSFNITKHEFVPKHVVLTSDEKKKILKKYKSQSKNFPLILSSDPICRYYGCLPGTMLRIERESETCGIYTLYRVVV
jgi:DNA-directed RNA polymerases I, II, and III subunit RPABC1